jgi:OmpA-OmpF porin, OOP family
MHIRVFLAALIAAVVTGCTSYSSPMTNTDVVTLPNGDQAWRVQCQGLLGGAKTCYDRAQAICKDQKVRLIGAVDHMGKDLKAVEDQREITFACGDVALPPPPPLQQPAPPPPPEPKPLRAVTLEGDANFALNRSELTPVAQRKLDEFIEASRGYQITRLTISGYTDSTGPMRINQPLSEARAKSVQRYLASHGFRADMVEAHGYGPSNPVATNSTAAGRAKNRRVEIRTEGIEVRAMVQ